MSAGQHAHLYADRTNLAQSSHIWTSAVHEYVAANELFFDRAKNLADRLPVVLLGEVLEHLAAEVLGSILAGGFIGVVNRLFEPVPQEILHGLFESGVVLWCFEFSLR